MFNLIIAVFLFVLATIGAVGLIIVLLTSPDSVDTYISESGRMIIGLMVAVPVFYCMSLGFAAMWYQNRREEALRKISSIAFLESGMPLSWFEQKIIGVHVVEKMQSGQLLHEMKEENEYAEEALADMAAQHRPEK